MLLHRITSHCPNRLVICCPNRIASHSPNRLVISCPNRIAIQSLKLHYHTKITLISDFLLLVPTPFPSSVPPHGMTFTFLSEETSLDSLKSNLNFLFFSQTIDLPCFPLHAATFHPCLLSVVGCKLCKVSILMHACACV